MIRIHRLIYWTTAAVLVAWFGVEVWWRVRG